MSSFTLENAFAKISLRPCVRCCYKNNNYGNANPVLSRSIRQLTTLTSFTEYGAIGKVPRSALSSYTQNRRRLLFARIGYESPSLRAKVAPRTRCANLSTSCTHGPVISLKETHTCRDASNSATVCNLAHGRRLSSTTTLARLSSGDVTRILRRNEVSVSKGLGPSIARYDCNQLESNSPVEDRAAEARCIYTTGNLFGVFGGHAGPACAQATSERLFQYIGLSLLPPQILENILVEAISMEDDSIPRVVHWLGGPDDSHARYFQEILAQTYSKSLLSYAEDLLKEHQHFEKPFRMEEALTKSYARLDKDLSREALTKAANEDCHDNDALDIAFSGAVATVAHVDGIHVHVACCGDVQAVVGCLEDDGETWSAKPLTVLHNADNKKEMNRLFAEHPGEEETIVRNERLLGQLIPLRAFGDVRFKWSADDISSYLNPYVSYNVVPQFYKSPPYLHAVPEVTYHRLTPRDRFLVIASDGLWDMMTPSQVVNVVGSWKRGIQSLKPFELPEERTMTISEIHQRLKARVQGRKSGIADTNAATHLIRHALGGTESGVDHRRLSSMLALPQDVSRLYRDDITISVLHFNLNYLRTHPA